MWVVELDKLVAEPGMWAEEPGMWVGERMWAGEPGTLLVVGMLSVVAVTLVLDM